MPQQPEARLVSVLFGKVWCALALIHRSYLFLGRLLFESAVSRRRCVHHHYLRSSSMLGNRSVHVCDHVHLNRPTPYVWTSIHVFVLLTATSLFVG
jgi:hypothetical protein